MVAKKTSQMIGLQNINLQLITVEKCHAQIKMVLKQNY